ncbi:hypothetical protein KAI92_02005 [Candidatus Parcubacteria bacterium]|nr:hypothetical protein [Candidatus Parcubacteria bacterium]
MENQTDLNQMSWEIQEYETHKKSKKWYIIASIIAILSIIYAIAVDNILFIIIIVLSTIIIIMRDKDKIGKILVIIDQDGIHVGQKSYSFDEFKTFVVLYKPKQNIKNIYLEYKNPIKQRLSIPILNMDPLLIRKFLLKYIDEDLDRTNRPLSEELTAIFKL